MNTGGSLPRGYFDALYARDGDPWKFASSPYEQAKYSATLQALPAAHFSSAFEVGCSIGVLSRMLAKCCTALLAVDVAEAALVQARRRCADLDQVEFDLMQIPGEWPRRRFDLIVLSEVLYYLSPNDVACTARLARDSLRRGGAILLVHYILPTDYPCSGDSASGIFIAESQMTVTLQRREAAYRLDLLRP
jgi:cyclopropane fatty-acyl-phospholipid synthase-like methyltransferase